MGALFVTLEVCKIINKESTMQYRTTQDTTIKSYLDVINVPKGTKVLPIKCGGDSISYAVADDNVLKQQNSHDRKYRYVWVPTELVESC